MISRVYEGDHPDCWQRRFCGFCGTPLTYWSDVERDFILVTLGSLSSAHLNGLADMGFVSEDSETSEVLPETPNREKTTSIASEPFTGVGWIDDLMQGSPIRNMKITVLRGVQEKQTAERIPAIEWEISEWRDHDDSDDSDDSPLTARSDHVSTTKRKLEDMAVGTTADA
jgi:hypothetical protein